MFHWDGSGRIFVVEREGRIKIINKDKSVNSKPFLDLTTLRSTVINPGGNDVQSKFIEQGLFSIAFHPKFKNNGFIYVHYSSLRLNGSGVIVRFTVFSMYNEHKHTFRSVTADNDSNKQKVSGEIRTRDLHIRSATPYPLGHRNYRWEYN